MKTIDLDLKILDPSVLRYFRFIDPGLQRRLDSSLCDNHIYQGSFYFQTDILPVLPCYEPNDENYWLSLFLGGIST